MTKTSEAYGTRENWPPYTYRDYPGIKPEAYEAFMKFLSTENTSGRLMELQPWVSVCDSKCAFCYFPTTASNKVQLEPYLDLLKKELAMYAKTKYVKTSVFVGKLRLYVAIVRLPSVSNLRRSSLSTSFFSILKRSNSGFPDGMAI